MESSRPSGLPIYGCKRITYETHWRAPGHGTKGGAGELMHVTSVSGWGGAGALRRNLCKL